MLPLDEPWYRRLIAVAIALGLAGGVLGLAYLGATGELTDAIFETDATGWWSGEWWWIPVVAAGGLVVAALRSVWAVPDKVPGGVEMIEDAVVDHKRVPKWVIIAAISSIAGASLGPSFALILIGGGLGSWIAERRWGNSEADQEYTLTGIAGGFGGAFTAPILAATMVSELAPTPHKRYVAAIIPQLIAATLGFIVFYSVVGRTFLGLYRLPPYEFELVYMAVAVGLGFFAAVVMAVMVVVLKAVARAAETVPNRYVRGAVGGGAVGLLAVALPLTFGSGNSQLDTIIEAPEALGVGLLVAVLAAKMVAVALSLAAGFLGGNVFPLIFIGGTAGVLVHEVVPDIPYSLAVACMLAAVPGAYLNAPISLTFIAVITIGLGARTAAPVAVSVLTSYLLASTISHLIAQRRAADDEELRA